MKDSNFNEMHHEPSGKLLSDNNILNESGVDDQTKVKANQVRKLLLGIDNHSEIKSLKNI
jgi:hypothetical protein